MAVRFLLLLLLLLAASPAAVQCRSTNEAEADAWYEVYDRELGRQRNLLTEANWENNVNITHENARKVGAAQLVFAEFMKNKSVEMRDKFDWTNFRPDLKRLFEKAADIGTNIANETMQIRLSALQNVLRSTYSTAKVREVGSDKELPLDPDITRLLADPNVSEPRKRHLWVSWRDASGRKMRQNYTDFVTTLNLMIREAGYENMTQYWQGFYEPKPGQNFEKMMEDLWNQVLPLYQQLHAYVKFKLKRKYGEEIFPPTGQIPAHILGNMWSQSWANTERDTSPFPELSTVDITDEMRRQGWTAMKMFKVSEEFFTSIGLKAMTQTFWDKSVIERIPNVEMVCHASAWDFYTGRGDFRIKQCTDITTNYLGTTHHEMGHIQYYQQYEHQKVLNRRGANPGFHEAIGDVMELSVMTPEHLQKIGLLNKTDQSHNYYINFLFHMALSKVAFLPFGYLIDRWRWRAFDNTISPQQYNEFWWRLRCQLQGVASPVRRTAEDFDPGAKYHVPSNTPYIRYFVSHILQFQFYKALCKAANHTGPLYKCDFYQNIEAGKVMEKMMRDGSSRHWEDVLFDAVGTRQMSAEPLLEYFGDLKTFLEAENRKNGVKVEWEDSCPPDHWYDAASTQSPPETTTSGAGLLSSSFAAVAVALLSLASFSTVV